MIGEAKSHPGSVIVSNAVLEQEKDKKSCGTGRLITRDRSAI